MTYRPLPEGVTVGPSGIDGMGLIATEELPAAFPLGITHYLFPEHEDPKSRVIRTPAGGWINHSDTPNCVKMEADSPHGPCWKVTTSEIVPVGTELTIRYTLYVPGEDE